MKLEKEILSSACLYRERTVPSVAEPEPRGRNLIAYRSRSRNYELRLPINKALKKSYRKKHGCWRRVVNYYNFLILLFSAPQQWAYCTSYKRPNTDMPESSPDSVLICYWYLKHLSYRIADSKFEFCSVLGIRDFLRGSGSPDPYLWLMDPTSFFMDFKDAKK